MEKNIFDFTQDELAERIIALGDKGFRAKQVATWLYNHKAGGYEEMANIPSSLREMLTMDIPFYGMEEAALMESSDGETVKYAFQLADGQLIETVLMHYDERETACLSTQAGCALGCVFCATGQMGFARNLSAGEIIAQAMILSRSLESKGKRLTNIVLMGMGEPFQNYDEVMKAIRIMIDPAGLGIGQRHITVSTAGIVPEILRFADEGLQVRLAISLHAAEDDARSALMPINRKYGLTELMDSIDDYIAKTGRRVSFEYALIDGQNDTSGGAHALANLLEGRLCHVNLIPLNPTGGFAGDRPDNDRVRRFAAILESRGLPVTVRLRRGIDIQAGCGQLKSSILNPEG